MSGRRTARVAASAVRVGAIRDPSELRAALRGFAAGQRPENPPTAAPNGERPTAISAGAWRRMSRLSRMVAEVAIEALGVAEAELGAPFDRSELYTVWGTALGEMTTTSGLLERLFVEGPDKVSPHAFQTSLFGTPIAHLSMILGLTGPSETVSAGGASSAAALLRGIDAVASGRSRAALVLAGDELSQMLVTAWGMLPDPPAIGEAVSAIVLTAGNARRGGEIEVVHGLGPVTRPIWQRGRAMPVEGPIPLADGAVATEGLLGACPAVGLALVAAASRGGGTVIEWDGATAYTIRVAT